MLDVSPLRKQYEISQTLKSLNSNVRFVEGNWVSFEDASHCYVSLDLICLRLIRVSRVLLTYFKKGISLSTFVFLYLYRDCEANCTDCRDFFLMDHYYDIHMNF